LRSILWKVSGSLTRATRWAAGTGQIIAYGFIVVGIWMFFTASVLNGLWFGFIGWFLLQAARSEERQLELEQAVAGVRVADVMLPPPPSCTTDCTLRELSDNYVLRSGLRTIPVTSDGAFVGLVTLKDALKVPREQWDQVPVSQIMIPRDRVVSVRATEPLAEALKVLMPAQVSQVPVIADDRLEGILNVEHVLRWLQVRRTLYPERGSLPKAS
jgi:CBS domain-containing protein